VLLRRYWVTHKNPVFIFPAVGRGHNMGATSKTPMALDSVQGAFRQARLAAGIIKRRVSIHTLRHYAESRTMPSDAISSLSMNGLFRINSA